MTLSAYLVHSTTDLITVLLLPDLGFLKAGVALLSISVWMRNNEKKRPWKEPETYGFPVRMCVRSMFSLMPTFGPMIDVYSRCWIIRVRIEMLIRAFTDAS